MNTRSFRKLTTIIMVMALLLPLLPISLIITTSRASAASPAPNPTATWVSDAPGKIFYNGKVYHAAQTTSTTMRLEAAGACHPVHPTSNFNGDDWIDIGISVAGSGSGNTLDYHTATVALEYTVGSNCQVVGSQGYLINLTNTYNSSSGGYAEWAASSTMVNLSTGDIYKENSIDANGVMTLDGPMMTCGGPTKVTVGDQSNFVTATTATITTSTVSGSGHGQCTNGTDTLTLINTNLDVATAAQWLQADTTFGEITIHQVGATTATVREDSNGNVQQVNPIEDSSLNSAEIAVGNTWAEDSGNIQGNVNGDDMTLYFPASPNCKGTYDPMHVNPYQTALYATITIYSGPGCAQHSVLVDLVGNFGNPTGNNPGGNPVSTDDGCSVPTSEALRWIACPIISMLQGAATALNGFIGSLLEVSPSVFFNSGTQNAFNVFRNLGVALLVIAGLVMVVSQAADLELFAAHTVRKALPRIIIAAILISLAWPLLQFVIGFFNDMGAWTGKIILSVGDAVHQCGGAPNITTTCGSDPGTVMATLGDGLIAGLVAAGGAIIFLGSAGIISLIISAILLALVAAFVLMIRQIVILICILTAPLALASYVLPGTEKIGRFWKDTLITALAMYILIEGSLTGGAALASIILAVKGGSSFYRILALIVFIAPYLLIPLTFRITGGAIGRIAEFAQGTHHKTIEGRLQAGRQGIAAKNMKALSAGSRWNPNSRWTKWTGGAIVNRVGAHMGAGMRGRFGIGAVGQAAMANNMVLSADAASKMDTNFAAQMNNEDAMAAVAFGNNAAALSKLRHFQTNSAGVYTPGVVNQDKLKKALAAGRTIQATQQIQTAAADALVRSGKVLDNRSEFSAMIDSVAHGNGALAGSLDGNLRYTARQIGRQDIGRGDDYEALKEMDLPTLARQKPKSLKNLFGGNAIINAINASPLGSDEQQHFADLLFAAQNNASLSPEQQQQIAKAVITVQSSRMYGSGSGNDIMAKAATNYSKKFTPSDRRLKQNIRHLQTLGNDVRLYSFQYIWGGPQYVGVMAQDLLDTRPEAILIDHDGYYRVRYDLLGLEMLTLDEWQNGHAKP